MHSHACRCDGIKYLVNLNNLFNNLNDLPLPPSKSSLTFMDIVNNNFKILHSCKLNNSDLVLFIDKI